MPYKKSKRFLLFSSLLSFFHNGLEGAVAKALRERNARAAHAARAAKANERQEAIRFAAEQARLAAEQEAARIAAEQAKVAQEEAARQEAIRVAAEQARLAAEQESARIAAEQAAAQQAKVAQEEAARQEAVRVAAEQVAPQSALGGGMPLGESMRLGAPSIPPAPPLPVQHVPPAPPVPGQSVPPAPPVPGQSVPPAPPVPVGGMQLGDPSNPVPGGDGRKDLLAAIREGKGLKKVEPVVKPAETKAPASSSGSPSATAPKTDNKADLFQDLKKGLTPDKSIESKIKQLNKAAKELASLSDKIITAVSTKEIKKITNKSRRTAAINTAKNDLSKEAEKESDQLKKVEAEITELLKQSQPLQLKTNFETAKESAKNASERFKEAKAAIHTAIEGTLAVDKKSVPAKPKEAEAATNTTATRVPKNMRSKSPKSDKPVTPKQTESPESIAAQNQKKREAEIKTTKAEKQALEKNLNSAKEAFDKLEHITNDLQNAKKDFVNAGIDKTLVETIETAILEPLKNAEKKANETKSQKEAELKEKNIKLDQLTAPGEAAAQASIKRGLDQIVARRDAINGATNEDQDDGNESEIDFD